MDSDSKDKNGSENIPPNPFIIIAFLAAIAGIGGQLIKSIRKSTYHIVVSLIGLASLLIFYLTFQAKMEGHGSNKIGMGFGDKVTISYGFGTAFYLCGVLFLILLLFYGIFSYFLKNDPEAIYGHSKQNTES
jgi:membrane protease YdiL (CAAX protease family)